MASQLAGSQRQHESHVNGTSPRDWENPGVEKFSRRPALPSDDADAADILQAWDRARAAQNANVQRGMHIDSGVGPDVSRCAGGVGHEEEALGHSSRKHQSSPTSDNLTSGLLTSARYQHSSAHTSRMLGTASTEAKGPQPSESPSPEVSPTDKVRRAKHRRNSYSVPQYAVGVPDILYDQPLPTVKQQVAPLKPSSEASRLGRRLPPRRATLHDLKADLSDDAIGEPPDNASSATPEPPPQQLTSPWSALALLPGQQGPSPVGGHMPSGSPKPTSLPGRDATPVSSSGQQLQQGSSAGELGGTSVSDAGIRLKIIKMISVQRTRQRSMAGNVKLPGMQASQPSDVPEPPLAAEIMDTNEVLAKASTTGVAGAAAGGAAGEAVAAAQQAQLAAAASQSLEHDSDDEDVEDVHPSGQPPANHWNMNNGIVGPSTSELRMMGAASSVSFKKSTMKQGVLRPLSTLPPFVPRLFIEDITLNHEKYRGFDAAGRDLTAASKTLQPSIIELQAAVMIADVTGFTQLTEILSKKGTSGVELLTTCMNNYFTRAINMIMAFEGDVIKFAGDSMIVLFYPNEHERRHADKGLRACTLRMMACAHQLATKLGHMRMKMNGQVEPAPPPPPEPVAAGTAAMGPPLALPPTVMSVQLSSSMLPAMSNAVPSSELDLGTAVEGITFPSGSADMTAPKTSGGFSAGGVVRRLTHGESPRSSATNHPLLQAAVATITSVGGEDASFIATDPVLRSQEGPDSGHTGSGSVVSAAGGAGPRKRGKSWNLVANLLKANRGFIPRRSDAYGANGSISSAAASSSGPFPASFDKNDGKPSGRLSARERAKTETGLGLGLRVMGGGVDSGSGTSGAAGLWAGGEGVVRRELSVATKLNLPPPLRPMQPRTSLQVSPHPAAAAATAGGTASNAPFMSGVYPGSGSALTSLSNAALSSTISGGTPRSFTEQAASSGGSFRRVPLAGRSERRITGGVTLGAGTGDWRSKLQNLSTAIVNSGPVIRISEEESLALQRSRLSETVRAVRWDTVQEEEAGSEEDEALPERRGEDGEEDEDASYPPILSYSQAGGGGGGGGDEGDDTQGLISPQHGLSSRTNGQSNGGPEGGAPVSLPLDRMYSPVGSQSAGTPRSCHAVDLRRKLLLRASQSDRDDMHLRRNGGGSAGSAAGSSQREEGLSTGPGPVAEGLYPAVVGLPYDPVPYDGPFTTSSYDTEALMAAAADPKTCVSKLAYPCFLGPVAEATEDVTPGRSRMDSTTDGHGGSPHGGPPVESSKPGSFMSKVVNWFSANSRNRNGPYADSFSNAAPHAAGRVSGGGVGGGGTAGGGGGDAQSDTAGSQPPSVPASAANSFNYTTGMAGIARVPPPSLGPGSAMGKGTRGDPTMEEVSNSRLSLKVMTSAGSVCVFHVGGGVDEWTDPTQPEMPRWEFFIGDRPLAPLLDANQRRRCVSQVAAIEDRATAGSVVASIEVVELIQGEWEVMPLPDSVWRVMGPLQANLRLTSMRTSVPSHAHQWRSSEVGVGTTLLMGSNSLPAPLATAEQHPGVSSLEPHPPGVEVIEDLVALQSLRMTNSITNGQPGGTPSSVGQPSSVLGPTGHRSLAASLNGSSDRPTNGSTAPERLRLGAASQPHLHHPQQQMPSPLCSGISHSARFEPAYAVAAHGDSMERTNSVPAGTASQLIHSICDAHIQLPVPPSIPTPISHLLQSNAYAPVTTATTPLATPGPAMAPLPAATAAAAAAAAAATAQLPPRLRHEFVMQPEHVQRRIAGLLRMHVLGSVRIRVEAGHLDFINEIRPLTCMFLGFPSLLTPRDDVAHRDQVQCVQLAYTSVQAVMRKWDGSFLQFRSDEKGFVGICAFGLPGHTHEDNPTRGIRAALELASTIRSGGHTVAIGVTTGDLLCTCVGARKLRSEYTVFGDAINLSARLMVKSKKDPSMGEILCDEPTYLRAKYQASFVELERLPVKGKAQPVLVYRVGAHDATGEAHAAQQRREAAEISTGERPLIGRDAEMTLTLNQAASMISGLSQGGIIVLEGNTGMGKTKLLMDIRKSLERINADTSISSRPAFHMVFGMADTANKSQKLHPWRRVFQELFALDLKFKNLGKTSVSGSVTSGSGAISKQQQQQQQQQQQRKAGGNGGGPTGQCGGVMSNQCRKKGMEEGPGHAVFTALGERLSRVPNYDTEWRQHLAELLDLPLWSIPLGSMEAELAEQAQYYAAHPQTQQGVQIATLDQADGDGVQKPPNVGVLGNMGSANGGSPAMVVLGIAPDGRESMVPLSVPSNTTPSNVLRPSVLWRTPSMRHSSMTTAGSPPALLEAHMHASTINVSAAAAAAAAAVRGANAVPAAVTGYGIGGPGDTVVSPHGQAMQSSQAAAHNNQVGAPIRKNSLNFLVHVMQEFISLYGPTLALLENLHDFDTWSWQLLVKASELIHEDCVILATTRPNDLPAMGSSHHLHGKAALYQKVAMMYRHLLKLPSATRIVLEPFNFAQTRSLMQVVSDVSYPDQYVLAVMEKTGGMPLYIEKVTEFLCQSQRPWLPEQGGEFSANVNKMIRNLNFQQVIIERMDRLKPGIHLTLKVASVMGQWVDLDILHKFYPINKSKEELRAHLKELERGNFLKATDAEGVWEFNMVERDIVYEVIPHYQRRRMHAKLAQELEKSLEEQHVATLTTIAYHWNQACMGHEVAEVECSLKAIEFWHRAAEAAYSGSSLMEALKLYQKAAQIAEVLAESISGSITGTQHALSKGHDRHADGGPSAVSISGRDGGSVDGRIDAADQSFTAVGSAFRGPLNWSLISRLSRSQWEKSMASCCLGIVLQHRYEFNTQLEYWDTEDYFRLLTEHAIRGLMLLGAPHPNDLLSEKGRSGSAVLGRVCGCCFGSGSSSGGVSGGGAGAGSSSQQHGWHTGLVLQDSEVQEIRDILLVLIIAAEHYSLQHDGGEYTRLLTFCKRVCKYFNKCSDTGTDPFMDIRSACSLRIKNYKATRALQTTLDFGVNQEPALEAAAARNTTGGYPVVGPELSRAVLGWHRQGTLGRAQPSNG